MKTCLLCESERRTSNEKRLRAHRIVSVFSIDNPAERGKHQTSLPSLVLVLVLSHHLRHRFRPTHHSILDAISRQMRTHIMTYSKHAAILSITCMIVLCWNSILVPAFNFSPFRLHRSPIRSSPIISVCLRVTISDENEGIANTETGSVDGCSILLADSREKVLAIKLYRFGGPTIEEYLKSKPDLKSPQDALRSLTPSCDDRGVQRVFYSGGISGESVQFFAQANDIADFISSALGDDENAKLSLMRTGGVLGSVEAVREYVNDGDATKQVSIELKNLSVHPNARRRGIGKALTEAVQEYARCHVSVLKQEENQSYTGIVHLTVESENEGAVRLYKETGFVPSSNELNGEDDDDDDELCTLTWSTE